MNKKFSLSFDKKTFLRLWKSVSSYRRGIFLSITASVLFTASSLLVPVAVGKMIDLIGSGKHELFLSYMIFSFVLVIVGGVSQTVLGAVNNRITYSVLNDLRNEEFKKISSLPVSYIDSHPHGDTVSRIISDTETVADGLIMGFTQFFTGIMTIVATLVIMLFINPVIALAVVVLTPLSIVISSFIASKTGSYFKTQAKIKGEITSKINETVGAIETVHYLGISDKKIKEFNAENEKYRISSHNAVFFSSLVNPTTRFVNATIYASVACLGAIYCISGGLTVGSLSVFLSYAGQYTKPFNEISGVMAELQNALACAARIFEFNDLPEMSADGAADFTAKTNGKIEISHVSFGYKKEKPIYKDFSVTVNPGQKIAIVGPTGCGKTTLINLLMRFYEPDSGRIFIDGTDISTVPRRDLRRMFGMVLQDTFIMHGTVRDNIRMGRPDATDEEIKDAAVKTHCNGFISRLKDGYDTVLSENGDGLSDGQKQLLCICRAMVSNPKILILDEATSSIDTRTEMKVQAAMDELAKGRTAFIVAHRLSTVVNSDVILALKDGRVEESGTHKELMAKNGYYAGIFNSQFGNDR